ncbi:UPF0481 protein At3g47200-like [Zingiber officinale]|uniref:UPF0481 protein At3g47200-like n=1 Tax=Zingiber officinale TaxID=94328 RepID=UPI001C4AC271|nr:UPF0481 protein At3g47200-like [Zingiber officinale]
MENWVVEIREELKNIDQRLEIAQWSKRSIYKVPACIKDLNPKVYRPQVVSFGPYHHGALDLAPMEGHKRRALLHFLKRSKRPLEDFVAAMKEVAGPLREAYEGVGDEWRDEGKFLSLMITDACFMLEIMRAATTSGGGGSSDDYAVNDPVLSIHGMLYYVPYIRRDMLILENQLPLLALDVLLTIESGKPAKHDHVNKLVLKFLGPPNARALTFVGLGLHPLDVFRRSLLHLGGPSMLASAGPPDEMSNEVILSAVELYEAGIRFQPSKSNSLRDIRFHRGVLSLPVIVVDDSTEYMFLNQMAFERLHVGAGNEVTSYVFFMNNIIDSAMGVSLLHSKGIIQNAVGSDKAVVKLFNSLSKDVVLDPDSNLDEVHRRVNKFCRKSINMWRAHCRAMVNMWWASLIYNYFRSPWTFLSLVAATLLLVLTALQTVYTIVPYYNKDTSPSRQ